MNPDLNLEDVALLRQREIERLFAGALFMQPVLTVQTCGWLKTEWIQDEKIRRFWGLVREKITPNMDQDQVASAISAVSMEANILAEVTGWMGTLPFQAEPLDFAREIDRRRLLASASVLAGRLAIAIRDQDDDQVRAISRELADMESAQPQAEPDGSAWPARIASRHLRPGVAHK